MKYGIVFVVVALASIVYAVPQPDDDKYTTKYDNIDVDSIIQNDRLIKNYIDCIDDKGKCTPEGEELKENLIDGLKTCCAKCSEKQKSMIKKVFKYLAEKKPEMWDELRDKYDPGHEFETECRKNPDNMYP